MLTNIENKLIEEMVEGKQNPDDIEELVITLEHEEVDTDNEESDICNGTEGCPKCGYHIFRGLDLTSINIMMSKQPIEEGGNDTYYFVANSDDMEWEANVIMKCNKCGYILTDDELQVDEKGNSYKDIKLIDFGILIRVYINQED